MTFVRKAFVMQLKPGAADEYKRRHDELWPEMSDVLKAHGVHNYSIYLHGTALFAYAEIEDPKRWDSLSTEAAVRKWWDHMADLMQVNEDNSPVVQELQEMFHIE